ncbi:inactive histone-lysine N-methyltransferase 2E-like [Puntigrus tetrazona]|uniref:inactive histone-lysine N-methyltransferase 2E-like n=1 Tax=Puntigrus tetrazona TaxID=1606681 RepID=UPI001C88FA92|nr:inactive histone-lysine N-methyltransferase 2E-like [Puntigrus tetrazona]
MPSVIKLSQAHYMLFSLLLLFRRGVFSCADFEKGDFLLEYRGDLIDREECERRQRIYHDALKVYIFEFRYNGKLLCIDAARDDGSLGRLVNDDHINPNSRMRTISADGKPHLCLFATKSICPGEEITYNYGASDWPWRCTTVSEGEPSTLEVQALSQSDVRDTEKLAVVSDQSTCATSEGLKKTLKKDQLLLDQDCFEKMSPVKENVLNEKQSFCVPAEGVMELCKHVVVSSAISCMDKCAKCVGPVAALKWIGLRCTLCSSFWHKSCYAKHHEWNEQSSWMRSI